jgi:hypothetical protein
VELKVYMLYKLYTTTPLQGTFRMARDVSVLHIHPFQDCQVKACCEDISFSRESRLNIRQELGKESLRLKDVLTFDRQLCGRKASASGSEASPSSLVLFQE